MIATASSPGLATAMPSAIVEPDSTATGWPAASDAGNAATASACTPITRIGVLALLAATAMPETRPPPPAGTAIVRTPGHCSMISRPTVPWPTTTSGCSKGWMKTRSCSAASALARARVCSTVLPCRTTSAPYEPVASTLGSGAPSGITTVALVPSSAAANATPWPWLPALAAMTPRARCASASRAMRR